VPGYRRRDILAAPAEREASIQNLESEAFNRVIACAEPGKRAAKAVSTATGRLSQTLLDMGDEELFS
jgi:hypothetical protein